MTDAKTEAPKPEPESLTGTADQWRQSRQPDGSLRLVGPDLTADDGTVKSYALRDDAVLLPAAAAP